MKFGVNCLRQYTLSNLSLGSDKNWANGELKKNPVAFPQGSAVETKILNRICKLIIDTLTEKGISMSRTLIRYSP